MQNTAYLFAGDDAAIVPDYPWASGAFTNKPVNETAIYVTSGSNGPEGNQVTFVATPLGADGATVKVEHSYDDPFVVPESQAGWFSNPDIPDAVISAAAPMQANYYLGVSAIRFTVTGGAAQIRLTQNV